LAPDMLANQLF